MKQKIQKLIEILGGRENITSATHCMTRLRIEIGDIAKIDKNSLEKFELAKGVVINGEGVQIIIGVKVKELFNELEIALKNNAESEMEEIEKKTESSEKKNYLSIISQIFLPMIAWILLTGSLQFLSNLIDLSNNDFLKINFQSYIKTLQEIVIYYFPVGLSYSIVKRFKGSTILGTLLGLSIAKMGYGDNLLLIVASTALFIGIKKYLNRFVGDSLKIHIVPVISLLLSIVATKFIISPVSGVVTAYLIDGLLLIFNLKFYPLLALIFGGVYALSVKYGLQHILLFLDLQLILRGVGTFFWPMVAISNVAQGSSVLGLLLLEKDMAKRKEQISAIYLAYVGITEPAMYGFNLEKRYAMWSALGASAVGGMICGIYRIRSMGIGAGGIPALFIVEKNAMVGYFYALISAIVIGVILTSVVGCFKKR